MRSMRTKTNSSILLLLVPSIAVSTPEVAPTWEQVLYITSSGQYDSDIVWVTHWPGLISETLVHRVKSPYSGYGFNTRTSDQGFNSGSSGRGFNLGYPSQGYNSGQGYNPGHRTNECWEKSPCRNPVAFTASRASAYSRGRTGQLMFQRTLTNLGGGGWSGATGQFSAPYSGTYHG